MEPWVAPAKDVLRGFREVAWNRCLNLLPERHRCHCPDSNDQFAATDEGVFITDRVVYTHMNNLRGKIEADPRAPRHLITVRGVGYRFES